MTEQKDQTPRRLPRPPGSGYVVMTEDGSLYPLSPRLEVPGEVVQMFNRFEGQAIGQYDPQNPANRDAWSRRRRGRLPLI